MKEALKIYRDLASTNPDSYRSYVALVFRNFGDLYQKQGRYAEVAESYKEALKIYRELEEKTPSYYGQLIKNLEKWIKECKQ